MALSYWPTTIPQFPLQSGADETLPDNRKVTTMDAGPAKIRLKATTAPAKHSYTYAMTKAQLDYFTAFYKSTVHYGTDTFYWPDWRISTDAQIYYLQDRFDPEADPPQWSANECDFNVSVDLEVCE